MLRLFDNSCCINFSTEYFNWLQIHFLTIILDAGQEKLLNTPIIA